VSEPPLLLLPLLPLLPLLLLLLLLLLLREVRGTHLAIPSPAQDSPRCNCVAGAQVA
jgi:hypothetical protein